MEIGWGRGTCGAVGHVVLWDMWCCGTCGAVGHGGAVGHVVLWKDILHTGSIECGVVVKFIMFLVNTPDLQYSSCCDLYVFYPEQYHSTSNVSYVE